MKTEEECKVMVKEAEVVAQKQIDDLKIEMKRAIKRVEKEKQKAFVDELRKV